MDRVIVRAREQSTEADDEIDYDTQLLLNHVTIVRKFEFGQPSLRPFSIIDLPRLVVLHNGFMDDLRVKGG